MKNKIITLILLINISFSFAQQITLNDCFKQAKKNYPLLIQQEIWQKSFSETNALMNKNWLPQVDFNAQATTQSDVTKVPIKMPNLSIPESDKEQYKATFDVKQLIWDGGSINKERSVKKVENSIEQQKISIDILKLKERISQVYFRILLIDENINILKLQTDDITTRLKSVQAAIDNGVVIKSNADRLKVEILKLKQRLSELQNDRETSINTLNLIIGSKLEKDAILISPQIKPIAINLNKRPEMELFELQKQQFLARSKTVTIKNVPRLSAFAQGGYGKPGLNMFDPEFQFFYIAGLRLNWTLWNWNSGKNEKNIYSLATQIIDKQKDIFTLNTKIQIEQQQAEITKYETLLKTDNDIIELQTSIKKSATSQFDNGTLSANDYLNELNAENMAKLNLKLHKIQLIMAKVNLQLIIGETE